MRARRGRLKGLKKTIKESEVFDSLLERDYMLELELDNKVKSWTKEHGIRIPYRLLLLKKTYLPDFLVTFQNGSQEIHETKGAGFLSMLTTHLKRAAADQWCREHKMKYRFIENSRGAMFAGNNTLGRQTTVGRNYDSVDKLLENDDE